MSRFHDEFFRAGSPEHDALMIKCLSKKGIDKICAEIDTFSEIKNQYDEPAKVMICNLVGDKRCVRFGSVEESIKSGYKGKLECNLKYSSYYENMQCRHYENCQFSKTGLLPVDMIVSPHFEVQNIEISKETEVIVRNGAFIIGYADAVIELVYKGSVNYQIDGKWTWKAFDIDKKVKILIEAKPKLTSIGEVIRQLKTYKQIIEHCSSYVYKIYPIIVTYTKLDEDAIDYLRNEDISVVVFEHGEAP